MRTFRVVAGLGLVGLAFGLSPAVSFGQRTQETAQVTAPLPQNRAIDRVTPLGTVPIPPANIPNAPTLSAVPPAVRPAPPTQPVKPIDALRSGAQMLRQGQV